MAASDNLTLRCSKCNDAKMDDEFYPQKANTGRRGRASICKRCYSLHNKQKRYSLDKRCACGARIQDRSTTCSACNPRARKTGKQRANGYVRLSGFHGHPLAAGNGTIPEHRLIMSEMIGRPLRPHENVHHVNGVRDDNRPENLELWITSQPSGQRPQDLVSWAYEIIEEYGDWADWMPETVSRT